MDTQPIQYCKVRNSKNLKSGAFFVNEPKRKGNNSTESILYTTTIKNLYIYTHIIHSCAKIFN